MSHPPQNSRNLCAASFGSRSRVKTPLWFSHLRSHSHDVTHTYACIDRYRLDTLAY